MTTTKVSTVVSSAIDAKPNVAYEQLIGKADKLVFTFNSQGLRFYWELGHIIHDLCSNAPKYGNRTVETFCDDLKKANGNIQFEKTSLYNAKKFYTLINEELLVKAIEGRVTWRGIIDLISDSVTNGQRQSLIQGVASGKYTLGDLTAQLDKIKNRTEKKEQPEEKASPARETEDDSDSQERDNEGAETPAEEAEPKSSGSLVVSPKLDLTHSGKVKGVTELLAVSADRVEGFGKSITVMLEETTKQKRIEDIVEMVNLAEDNYNMLKSRWEKEIATASEACFKATGKTR